MDRAYGVADTVFGYSNGTGENPSYEEVIQGDQEFAETVEITHDPNRVSLGRLIDDLFQVIDPTTKNKQGNDRGIQNRTGIYYNDENDAEIVKKAVKNEEEFYNKPIVTLPKQNRCRTFTRQKNFIRITLLSEKSKRLLPHQFVYAG